jgi:TonB family protein
VILSFAISESGRPEEIRLVRGAGFGLDERAIQSVSTWRFDPANRAGRPLREQTRVELNFRNSAPRREGQSARLHFSLSAEVQRPQLVRGEMPVNPVPADKALVRIRLTVSPCGVPQNLQILEATNQSWAEEVVHQMQEWRFTPSQYDGQPQEASGVFELAVHRSTPDNTPQLGRTMIGISSASIQDRSLPAPRLIAPPDHAMFDGYPRRITCRWEAASGAYGYLLEWDYMYQEVWNADYQGVPGAAFQVNGTEFTFNFVGPQPGRWRVWPVNASGLRGNPSEWRTFRYLR